MDGSYESATKTFDRFFDHWHKDHGANEASDEYSTELLRGTGADKDIASHRRPATGDRRQAWNIGPTGDQPDLVIPPDT